MPHSPDMKPATDWPARAWVYGTWGYAVERAREQAARRRLRMWVYAGVLDGESVWVAALDPKRVDA
jgi:hypothetical protein